MPCIFAFMGFVVANSGNRELAKEGLDTAQTYLAAIPVGFLLGYACDKMNEFFESMGYVSSGRVPRP